MKIRFCLGWVEATVPKRKAFKFSEAYSLFQEYVERISRFLSCRVSGRTSVDREKGLGVKLWVCHRGIGARMLSSEEVAVYLQREMNAATKELQIVIGGPDGFSKQQLEQWEPDLKWSFGPLALPHELAAVVAGEQIYRALTILHNLPYHAGH